MNLKLPLEVEVPDVVYVGEIELACEQVNDYIAIYDRRDNGGSFPYISIDLAEGKITGYVDGLDVWETFSVDGDGLYEAVLDIAKELTKMMSEGYNKWKQSTKKSRTQPTSFSQQVAKQRAKNNSIDKSRIDWDDLVEKGQTIAEWLTEIKKAIESNDDRCSNEDSILMIIDEIEDKDLIYNLNWNLTSAKTMHRHDN